jgi:hypothetical protein
VLLDLTARASDPLQQPWESAGVLPVPEDFRSPAAQRYPPPGRGKTGLTAAQPRLLASFGTNQQQSQSSQGVSGAERRIPPEFPSFLGSAFHWPFRWVRPQAKGRLNRDRMYPCTPQVLEYDDSSNSASIHSPAGRGLWDKHWCNDVTRRLPVSRPTPNPGVISARRLLDRARRYQPFPGLFWAFRGPF